MKYLLEMQKFQMKTESCTILYNEISYNIYKANESLPTILVEDTCKLEEEPKTDDETITEARSQSSTLKRQSKFMKGAARPKHLVSKNSSSNNNMHQSLSWQDLSKMLHKNLSAPSCENLSSISTKSLKPLVPSRNHVSQKLYSDNLSDQDSRVWSGRSCNGDMNTPKERFRRRESYQKAVNLEYPNRGRLLARSKHKTIAEDSSLDMTSQLSRFSSYSNLPNIC